MDLKDQNIEKRPEELTSNNDVQALEMSALPTDNNEEQNSALSKEILDESLKTEALKTKAAEAEDTKAEKTETEIEAEKIEAENSLANSLASQEIIYSQERSHINSKPFTHSIAFFLVFVLFLLLLFPLITAQRALFPIEVEYNSALAYMQESAQYFVPALAEGLYAKVFIAPLLFLHVLDLYLPENVNIYFISLAVSFVLFTLSLFSLALVFKVRREEFCVAFCVLFSTVLYLLFTQVVQFDFLFAALINFSLAFFFKAWLKPSAFFSLCFAFFFMTLAVFTNGALAFMLPLGVGLVFLLLRLDIIRLFKNDALIPFTLFLILLGSYYMLLYYEEEGAYVKKLYDMSFLNYPLSSWFNLKKEYLFFLLLLFPFLYLPLFANYKESFLQNLVKKKKSYLLIRAKTMRALHASSLTSQELEELALKATGQTIEIDDEKNEETKGKCEKSKVEKKLYKDCVQASSSLFMLCFFFVFILLYLALPNLYFGHFLIFLPCFALFMAKVFVRASQNMQRYYFIFLALCFLCISLLFITVFMLPQLQNLYPETLAFLSPDFLELLLQVPHLSWLAIYFIALALLLFAFSRMNAQKLLFLLTFLLIMLLYFVHYLLLPRVGVYLYTF